MKIVKIVYSFLFIGVFASAQVGINTSSPDPSAALDVQFKSGSPAGMLTPRMTTAQRTGISLPANGLLVYDTDLKTFIYNSGTTTAIVWTTINSSATGRANFKRIKSTDNLATVLAVELAAGGGSKYKLTSNTLYEINGTVTLNFPIDLNNAYVQGIDSDDDRIVSTGNIFDGSTGGTVKGLTLISDAGKVLNLSGTATENFIFRDCIVANSANVGTINNMGLVFLSIIQFSGNTTGITYSNISQLLLSNLGWFGNNAGTFEKLTGTFGLVEKQGGFSSVNGAAIGFDVSANPIISGDAVLESVVFTGIPSTGKYVLPYSGADTYAGYNFNNRWNVRSAGIPTETDASATANLYKNNRDFIETQTSGAGNINKDFKVNTGSTIGVNMVRFITPPSTTGRLTYKGKKPRAFQVTASVSYEANEGGTNTDYVFYFVRIGSNGTTVTLLPETETYTDTKAASIISTIPVSGTILLAENESVELHMQRINTNTNTRIDLVSYNLSLK